MKTVRLHPRDNIEIVVESDGRVPLGHKISIADIPEGASIVKFGHRIAVASKKISKNEHVHVHNVRVAREHFELDRVKSTSSHRTSGAVDTKKQTFNGYLREDGTVGIRNYVVVTSTVNCSATVVKAICRQFETKDLSALAIDGIIPVTHTQGCAQEIGGEAYHLLNRTIAGWVFHPNVVGALVIGLGCEGTTFQGIIDESRQPTMRKIPVAHIGIQDSGGTAETIRNGVTELENILEKLQKFERTPQPLSKLKLALNCGGSDSFSSITANPVLGHVSDMIASAGGTAALAEIPECIGTEDILYSRSGSDAVRRKLKKMFQWWESYVKMHGVSFSTNLAPGNVEGGISTIMEKSLGSVAKAGTSTLTDVVGYAEPVTSAGFVLMNTPGFDPVSITGLVAGGCQMVAFTTGRGSVFGAGIAPTIKIATTSGLFDRMRGDMDFNAGSVLEGARNDTVAAKLLALMLRIASGEKTCSEKLGFGWEEFIPWNLGETL